MRLGTIFFPLLLGFFGAGKSQATSELDETTCEESKLKWIFLLSPKANETSFVSDLLKSTRSAIVESKNEAGDVRISVSTKDFPVFKKKLESANIYKSHGWQCTILTPKLSMENFVSLDSGEKFEKFSGVPGTITAASNLRDLSRRDMTSFSSNITKSHDQSTKHSNRAEKPSSKKSGKFNGKKKTPRGRNFGTSALTPRATKKPKTREPINFKSGRKKIGNAAKEKTTIRTNKKNFSRKNGRKKNSKSGTKNMNVKTKKNDKISNDKMFNEMSDNARNKSNNLDLKTRKNMPSKNSRKSKNQTKNKNMKVLPKSSRIKSNSTSERKIRSIVEEEKNLKRKSKKFITQIKQFPKQFGKKLTKLIKSVKNISSNLRDSINRKTELKRRQRRMTRMKRQYGKEIVLPCSPSGCPLIKISNFCGEDGQEYISISLPSVAEPISSFLKNNKLLENGSSDQSRPTTLEPEVREPKAQNPPENKISDTDTNGTLFLFPQKKNHTSSPIPNKTPSTIPEEILDSSATEIPLEMPEVDDYELFFQEQLAQDGKENPAEIKGANEYSANQEVFLPEENLLSPQGFSSPLELEQMMNPMGSNPASYPTHGLARTQNLTNSFPHSWPGVYKNPTTGAQNFSSNRPMPQNSQQWPESGHDNYWKPGIDLEMWKKQKMKEMEAKFLEEKMKLQSSLEDPDRNKFQNVENLEKFDRRNSSAQTKVTEMDKKEDEIEDDDNENIEDDDDDDEADEDYADDEDEDDEDYTEDNEKDRRRRFLNDDWELD